MHTEAVKGNKEPTDRQQIDAACISPTDVFVCLVRFVSSSVATASSPKGLMEHIWDFSIVSCKGEQGRWGKVGRGRQKVQSRCLKIRITFKTK